MRGVTSVVHFVAVLLTLCTTFAFAELDLTYSVSQQCTPLNVSWTSSASGYPYTVWIMGNLGYVDAYRINSDYQPGADKITFQYVVPAPSMGLNSFVVAVADNNGNGNTTRPLGITAPSGSSTSCDPYTAFLAWQWAGDPTSGDMVECGNVRFYNIGDRGTRPFTLTWVPIQGTPITVQIPSRYTTNISTFIYNAIMPFEAGTQFQIVLGDASGGGSGGASQIYTAGSASNKTCLADGYQLVDAVSSMALPTATNVAVYRNLAGAISTSAPQKGGSSGGSHVGAIAGGAIGGAIALGVAIGCLFAFLIYRRRQNAKRQQARQANDCFVDIDGDEDELDGHTRLRPRRGEGVSQSYAVSPFVYEESPYDGDTQHQSLEMLSRSSRSHSYNHGTPLSLAPSAPQQGGYGDLLTAAGLNMRRSPSATQSHGGEHSNQSHGSQQGMLLESFTPPHPSFAAGSDQRGSHSSGFFHLTNDDSIAGPSHQSGEAGPLPNKDRTGDNAATAARAGAGAPRRVVMHSDGGPLPQPTSDDEDDNMDELPPQYGGWLQQQQQQLHGSSNADPSR